MVSKKKKSVPLYHRIPTLFYIGWWTMNQPISTSSKKFVCLHFKTMSLLDIHTYSCIPPWMFWDLNFCLEFLSWKMTRSVSFESEKCISQQKYTRAHVERKRLMIPLAWLKLAIRLLIIFSSLYLSYFSLSLSIHDKVSSSVKKVAYSITC